MNHAATTIVRGPSVEDLVRSVRRVIQKSGAGLLASLRPKGPYPVLWTGPVRVSDDCSHVTALGLELGHVFEAVAHQPDVAWAFPDGDGAEARLYGRMRLHGEGAPEMDDYELPVELRTTVVCISLEIPTHGISLMARLPHPFDRASRSVTALHPGRSMQQAVSACMRSAHWDRR